MTRQFHQAGQRDIIGGQEFSLNPVRLEKNQKA
jgi:hypothetical protein